MSILIFFVSAGVLFEGAFSLSISLSEHWIYTNSCELYGKLDQIIWANDPSHTFIINSKLSQSLASSTFYFNMLSSVKICFFKLYPYL